MGVCHAALRAAGEGHPTTSMLLLWDAALAWGHALASHFISMFRCKMAKQKEQGRLFKEEKDQPQLLAGFGMPAEHKLSQ